MTEVQILKKIDAWDNQDKISAIVEFVENLPVEQKSPKVLSELARAYNNLYWLDQTPANEKYLHKAIEVFNYLETEMDKEDMDSWHFRIGWSYFYLGNSELAKFHFEKHLQLSDNPQSEVPSYLDCIQIAMDENRSCVEIWNKGNISVIDQVKFLKKTFAEKCPKLLERLGNPASDEDFKNFGNQLNEGSGVLGFFKNLVGTKNPIFEDFYELHSSFSGQKDDFGFFPADEKWISLKDISAEQNRIINFLETNFGKDWQNIKMPEYNAENDDDPANETATFFETDYIKNTLYNPKWLPLVANDNYVILCDLDPVNEEYLGQIIAINLEDNLEAYRVSWLFPNIGAWLHYIKDAVKNEQWQYDAEKNALTYTPPAEAVYDEADSQALTDWYQENIGIVGEVVEDPHYQPNSGMLKVDIVVIHPNPNDPDDNGNYCLATRGLGAYYMPVPQGEMPCVELTIDLPPSWNPKSTDPKDTAPMEWLRGVANIISYGSWLGNGHTIPMEEMEGTDFKGFILSAANDFDEENEEYFPLFAELPSGNKVGFLHLAPIYKEEMDYKLDHSAADLFEKFQAYEIPFPPVLDPHRPNTCEGYEVSEQPYLLDNVAWSFGEKLYPDLTEFWEEVNHYNQSIDYDLGEDYRPFGTIFNSKKVKFIYEAWIKDKSQLYDFEELVNPDALNEEPEDGLYQVEIIATAEAMGDTMLGMELLQWINNTMYGKELGDHIFFEGINLEGREADGTPVVYVEVGS